MGCTESKLDDLPAVSLCKDRCSNLSSAIRHRYALSDAHSAYLLSLSSLGSSLHRFFLSLSSLPPLENPSRPSLSGSHLHFHSDDDDSSLSHSSDNDNSPLHHHHHHRHSSGNSNSSPIHTFNHNHNNNNNDNRDVSNYGYANYADTENLGSYPVEQFANTNTNYNYNGNFHMNYVKNEEQRPFGNPYSEPVGGFMDYSSNNNSNFHMNYVKNEATPSFVYEQRPVGSATVNNRGVSNYDYDNYGDRVGGFVNSNNNNGKFHMNYIKNEATPSVVYEQRPVGTETIINRDVSNYDYANYGDRVGGFTNPSNNNGKFHMNYMKNEATPSVLYEQRPFGTGTVRMEMGEPSYNPYSNPYNGNANFNSYNYGNGYSATMGNLEASSSKPPPPPPSPPRGSGWDFLNPFESFESYYPPHTPSSRDSKEVREEEGIPELEEEHEVVKEVYHKDRNFLQGGKKFSKELGEDRVSKEIETDNKVYDNNNNNRPSEVVVESDPVEYEVHVVDKKVVGGAERSGDGGDVANYKASGDSDIVKEIKNQFDRASESGSEVAKILEVGKFPYKKSAAYQVSSKVLQVITPSLPLHSNAESSAIDKSNPSYLDSDLVSGMRSGSLSSTLQKLYLWEKKLYEEVKIEEKMRVLHERKCRKLKRLDERGAEAQKIDTTRALVRSLSTKIRMAIQVVDKISVTINKLRDEELWPQLNEVVHGLTRMWKSMYECHHIQSQAIAQAKRLDAAAMHKHFSDDQLEATMQLEHELLGWTLRFSCWVREQKGFVQSLNKWLMKCLLYVPEETPDGIVPFSPGRLGAPPIFVICNQWAQAMDRISEQEVVNYMREFATTVLHLWERDSLEMRQRMMANKDMERKVKNLERKDQKIHKEIQALDKRIMLSSEANNGLPSHVVYQSETSKNISLQSSLQHIFGAMEKFVSNSVKAYDELLQRIEEDRRDRLSRENQGENHS